MPVFGIVREAENTVLVLDDSPDVHSQLIPVGTIAPGFTGDMTSDMPSSDEVKLRLVLSGGREIESIDIQDIEAGLDLRRADLLQAGGLSQRSILLAGAGSLGSKIGLSLAEAGVGRIVVLDRDRLDAANLSRHTCDLFDLGRFKAVALADQFRRRLVVADLVVGDALAMAPDYLAELISQVDLVVATMDSPAAQFTVNEICVDQRRPAIFAGAYERACGGEIVVLQPGRGPCLFCAVGFRAGLQSGIELSEHRPAYQDTEANQLRAEPGLSIDIGYVASVAAAHAMAVLDPTSSRESLRRADRGFVLVHGGSEPRGAFGELFRGPFEHIYARVRADEPCPICGWSGLSEEKEGSDGTRD